MTSLRQSHRGFNNLPFKIGCIVGRAIAGILVHYVLPAAVMTELTSVLK